MTNFASLAMLFVASQMAIYGLQPIAFVQRYQTTKMLGVEGDKLFIDKVENVKRRNKVDRTALRWVIESICKQLRSENQMSSFPYLQLPNRLLSSLDQLYTARTETELMMAAQSLDSVLLLNVKASEQLSPQVLERVLKVTSMLDLNHISIPLFSWILSRDDSMGKLPSMPSEMSYIALFNSFRRNAALEDMREAFSQLIFYCLTSTVEITLSTVAVNIFIASLCDAAITLHNSRNSRSIGSSDKEEIISSSVLSMINEAVKLLEPTTYWKQDTRSFNTVLNAIAAINDNQLMSKVQFSMYSQGIRPDTCTFNARFKMQLNQLKDKRFNDPEYWLSSTNITDLLNEVLIHRTVEPDQFSIQLMLMPMAKLNMWHDISELLSRFNDRYRRRDLGYDSKQHSNAYATFLLTLIECDEMRIAEKIFDEFLLYPSSKHALNCPLITTQHFNIMMQKMLTDSLLDHSIHEKIAILMNKMTSLNVLPDAYTYSIIVSAQQSSVEIYELWTAASSNSRIRLNSILYRSFMQAFNRVHDLPSACLTFELLLQNDKNVEIFSINNWNVLLKCLCDSFSSIPINFETSPLLKHVRQGAEQRLSIVYGDTINHLSPYEAMQKLFRFLLLLSESNSSHPLKFYPNSQTYCIMASAYATSCCDNSDKVAKALSLLQRAQRQRIPADGRFLNAIIRCYENMDDALKLWKNELRSYVLKYNSSKSSKESDMRACYHALCFVAGKTNRADVALRLVYAMKKDNIEPTETTLNCYNSGKRNINNEDKQKAWMGQHEAVLKIECCKYDYWDKRRKSEPTLRIIF